MKMKTGPSDLSGVWLKSERTVGAKVIGISPIKSARSALFVWKYCISRTNKSVCGDLDWTVWETTNWYLSQIAYQEHNTSWKSAFNHPEVPSIRRTEALPSDYACIWKCGLKISCLMFSLKFIGHCQSNQTMQSYIHLIITGTRTSAAAPRSSHCLPVFFLKMPIRHSDYFEIFKLVFWLFLKISNLHSEFWLFLKTSNLHSDYFANLRSDYFEIFKLAFWLFLKFQTCILIIFEISNLHSNYFRKFQTCIVIIFENFKLAFWLLKISNLHSDYFEILKLSFWVD